MSLQEQWIEVLQIAKQVAPYLEQIRVPKFYRYTSTSSHKMQAVSLFGLNPLVREKLSNLSEAKPASKPIEGKIAPSEVKIPKTTPFIKMGPFQLEPAVSKPRANDSQVEQWFKERPQRLKSVDSAFKPQARSHQKSARLAPIAIFHKADSKLISGLEVLRSAIEKNFFKCGCYAFHQQLLEQIGQELICQRLQLAIFETTIKLDFLDIQKLPIIVVNSDDLIIPALKLRLWRRIEDMLRL